MIGASESFDIGGFAFDTLLWTGLLIALVLLLRRPVTKLFGAPTAYALWLLPMLRLVLPPIELPAWAAPEAEPAAIAASETTEFVIVSEAAPAASAAPAEQAPTLFETLSALPWIEALTVLWLAGAAVFLWMRFSAYFSLRAELVDGAVEVGKAKGPFGTISLVETPGTNAPLAFGVFEPVIALPPGFMANTDRAARDLALSHELAHHRGFDLLINILVQPLFAIHWFNPLGRYGWLALRRDQEAACDARVVSEAPKEERALYASVIASFAAGPNVALAAPMACPVLGDKSIVQRLRNLKMKEQSSNGSRRLASRLMIGTAILALPLTASITYAESLAPEPPAPPVPTLAALGIQSAPEAPEPPAPPPAPEAPEIEEEFDTVIVKVDPDGEPAVWKSKSGKVKEYEKLIEKAKNSEENVFVMRRVEADARKNAAEARKEAAKARRLEIRRIKRDGKEIEEAELEVILEGVREGLADADEALREARIELLELENDEELAALAAEGRTVIKMSCDNSSEDVATTIEREDGQREIMICQSRVMAHALTGLKEARKSIEESTEMSAKMRKEVLKEIDQQIKRWEKEAR